MDPSRFTEQKTGRLVAIPSDNDDDLAFIPDPLPRNWVFPSELQPLLGDAREALARLDGIAGTLPDPHLLLHPLQQRESLRSSSLEGTFARPEELLLFELEPSEPQTENDRVNVWLEVSNYAKSLRYGWQQISEGHPVSLRLIRELHATLLTGVRGRDKQPGQFRKCQGYIGSDRRYVPPPVQFQHCNQCIDAFEKFIHFPHKHLKRYALPLSYILHYQFEAIHPFVDGNGRIGRLLLSLTIYQWAQLRMPWLYMSAFFERYKEEYIDNLFRISTHGDWQRWLDFCLRGTVVQCNDAIRRCESLDNLKQTFHQLAGNCSPRAHSLINDLLSRPIVTVPELSKRYDVTYPTAKSDIDKFIKLGILRQLPATSPKAFVAHRVFDIAYREPTDT